MTKRQLRADGLGAPDEVKGWRVGEYEPPIKPSSKSPRVPDPVDHITGISGVIVVFPNR